MKVVRNDNARATRPSNRSSVPSGSSTATPTHAARRTPSYVVRNFPSAVVNNVSPSRICAMSSTLADGRVSRTCFVASATSRTRAKLRECRARCSRNCLDRASGPQFGAPVVYMVWETADGEACQHRSANAAALAQLPLNRGVPDEVEKTVYPVAGHPKGLAVGGGGSFGMGKEPNPHAEQRKDEPV